MCSGAERGDHPRFLRGDDALDRSGRRPWAARPAVAGPLSDRAEPLHLTVEHVHASDGSIGRVQGLVIDPADRRVTHVLLQEGHLWGKHRVAIPIGAVTTVDVDGVRLSLTKDEVRALPPVELAS